MGCAPGCRSGVGSDPVTVTGGWRALALAGLHRSLRLQRVIHCTRPWRCRLAKSEDGPEGNWYALDSAGAHSTWRKYYINVCRPLSPVPGCDRYASACQMRYENKQVRPPSPPRPGPPRLVPSPWASGGFGAPSSRSGWPGSGSPSGSQACLAGG